VTTADQYSGRSEPHQESSALAASTKARRYEDLADASIVERAAREMEMRP
jgi:hypothetical protein